MSVLPEPHAPDPELVRKVATELAEVHGELTQVEEKAANLQDAAAGLEEHLALMGVPEDRWAALAEKKTQP